VGLYGVPGQSRYSHIWDVVVESLWGIILLVNAESLSSKNSLSELIAYFYPDKTDAPCVIAMTHGDKVSTAEMTSVVEQIQAMLLEYQMKIPIISLDPRDRESSLLALQAIYAICNQK